MHVGSVVLSDGDDSLVYMLTNSGGSLNNRLVAVPIATSADRSTWIEVWGDVPQLWCCQWCVTADHPDARGDAAGRL